MVMQQQLPGEKFYVSITGLRLKSVWHYLTFARHAIPCYQAAQSSPGNVWTSAKLVDGVQHTVTAWDSRAAMIQFKHSPVHRQAMEVFPTIATGKTYGYWTDELPDWDRALELWKQHGVEYKHGGCRHYQNNDAGEGEAATTSATSTTEGPVDAVPAVVDRGITTATSRTTAN